MAEEALSSKLRYRRGSIADLSSIRFEDGLSVTAEGIEFNVLGMGHEFWVAVQADVIIAVAVLGRESERSYRILHLEVVF